MTDAPLIRTVLLTEPGGASVPTDPVTIPGSGGVPPATPQPSISLSGPISHVEGNSGTTLFRFEADLDRDGSTAPYPYTWAVSGAAVSGADFGGAVPSGNGTFGPSETQKFIDVLVTGDTTVEQDEPFTVTLNVDGIGTVTSTGTILNDDHPSGATFAMTQLPSVIRVYQRVTTAGGGLGKGVGVVPVTLNVTAAGALYARCRAADGSIVQAAWQVTPNAPIANGPVNVVGVDARLGWFYLDLSGDGTTWSNGTTLIGMGAVVLVSGQSLAVRMFTALNDSGTINGSGVTISPNTSVFAGLYDNSNAYKAPAWGPWVGNVGDPTGAPYNSAGGAKLAADLVTQLGVNVAIVGCPVGNTSISMHTATGANNAAIRSLVAAVGGFEIAWMFVGHTDASQGMSARYFKSGLSAHFRFIATLNSRGSNFRAVVSGIPNVGAGDASNNWGSLAAKNEIRRGAYEWVQRDGKAKYTASVYVNLYDVSEPDAVHQDNAGAIKIANSVTAGLAANTDQPAGDQNLAAIAKQNGTTGGTVAYAGAGRFLGSAMSGGYLTLNDQAMPIVGPVTTAIWLKKAAAPGELQMLFGPGGNAWVAIGTSGHVILNAGTGFLEGAIDVCNGQWHFIALQEDHDPVTGEPTTKLYVDGVLEQPSTTVSNTINRALTVRSFDNGGGYLLDPATTSEFQIWTKLLDGWVPAAALAGTEPDLHAYLPLAGNANGQV